MPCADRLVCVNNSPSGTDRLSYLNRPDPGLFGLASRAYPFNIGSATSVRSDQDNAITGSKLEGPTVVRVESFFGETRILEVIIVRHFFEIRLHSGQSNFPWKRGIVASCASG